MSSAATITPPDWLDKSFLEVSLKKGLKNKNLKIQELNIKPAVAAGDNYASQMFRANIVLNKSERMSVVIKVLPQGEHVIEMVHDGDFFTKEANMLTTVLPQMYKLFPKQYDWLSAECYYSQDKPDNMLIMEDLCVNGFRIGDRFNGLDLDHSLFVVKSLARLHAGLLVLIKNKPEIKENYMTSIWSEDFDHRTGKFLQGGIQTLADEASKWKDYPVKYVELLRKLEPNASEKAYESYRRNENLKWNTLVHGDCWVNNMMFKYDDTNKVTAMKFVDFQLGSINSPMLDLNYFIFTSVQHDIRLKHLDRILRTYYDSFINSLDELDHDIKITFDELEKEFYSRLFFGFVAAVIIFPITCAPPSDVCDVNDLFDSNTEYKNTSIYQNKDFQKVVRELLPFFEKYNAI